LVHGIKLAKRELILHSCDQGEAPVGCCNPDHLRIGDPTDNIKDKVFRNRAGLNTTSVMQVKRLLERGDMSHADIAELIGVSRSTITMIATGQRHTYGEHELLTAAQRPPERPQDPQPDESGHVSNVSRDQWNPFAKPSARRRVDFY
jgi:predicted XRE-type DNA-binding protein